MDDQEVVRLWQEAVELIDKDDLTAAYERLEVIDDPPNAIVFNAAVLQMIGEYYEDAFEVRRLISRLVDKCCEIRLVRGPIQKFWPFISFRGEEGLIS